MGNDPHNRQTATRAAPGAGARSRQRGVTLVELMATTAISAVILGAAAPSFVDSVRANKARSTTQQLTGLLNDARSEAMKRNIPVLVCPSTTGTSCMSSWLAQAWRLRTIIVCYDADGDGACDASTTEAPNPIRTRAPADSTVTVTGPLAAVRFNGMGATASAISFSVSAGNGSDQASSISVATTGAVRTY
jgi:type IV fimbrial biogenesis protein FimT